MLHKSFYTGLFTIIWTLLSSSVALTQQATGTISYIDADSTRQMTLHFDKNSSVFFYNRSETKQRTKKTTTGADGEMAIKVVNTDPEGETVYKSLASSEMISRHMYSSYYKPKYNGDILVKEELPTIEWEISDETKQVGSFTCYLAKTTHKKRVFYAWFSYDIPVPFGPWELGGLPGLILEAYDADKRFIYLCNKIKVPADVKGKIQPPKDGKLITWEDYVDLHIGAEERVNNFIKAKLAAKGRKSSIHITVSDFSVTKPDGLMLVE